MAVSVNRNSIKLGLVPERQPKRQEGAKGQNSGMESWGRRPVRGAKG